MNRVVEIQSTFGLRLPQVPGKKVRFLEGDAYEAEVFPEGSEVPEWSAQGPRLHTVAVALCKQYDIPVSTLHPAGPKNEDE